MTESTPLAADTPPKNLFVEREGKKSAIIAFFDIDGTANDETIPEAGRLNTLAPAQQAITMLRDRGIPSGPITSRSFGEALVYQNLLSANGITVCEDGAVLILPQTLHISSKGLSHPVVTHQGQSAMILSNTPLAKFKDFVQTIDRASRNEDPQYHPVISTFSPPDQVLQAAGHHSIEFAKASMDRIASAYIVNPTTFQRKIIEQTAPSWGIRAFGEVINLVGADANKGKALQEVSRLAPDLFGTQAIIPVVFGNNKNDLPLFEQAHKMGGIAVIVGHPDVGFFLNEKDIPDFVVKSPKPYGHGMIDAIPTITQRVSELYKPL